jgi:phenylacetate-CoA ligase
MTGEILPWLRRTFVEPLHCAYTGSQRLTDWKSLERTQYWDEGRLRELQWKRLKELLHFVYGDNAFYHARFEAADLLPDEIRTPADIRKLPILTKSEIQTHTPSMISNGYKSENLLSFKTGGSTGKSLQLFITEECSELRNACARRHDRWTGWEPGETVGALWGNPKLPTSVKERLVDRLVQPTVYLDTMEFSEESIRRFAADWQASKATLLFGHAHSIYLLAVQVKNLGIDGIRPRGILSTSMMLLPHERRLIEEVFGIKVFDRYGCEEVSLIAAECERHEGMHLNIEHLFIEFLDKYGEEVDPGEPGRIVVTDLMNKAMPFIRYQVEDMGVPSMRKCPCGRGLPLMESVAGRVADFLVKRDGTRVAGVSLIENTLTKIPGITQMQIVQESMDSLILNIVPGEGFTSTEGAALQDYFSGLFGNQTSTKLNLVSGIKPEISGKYRFSICNISDAM